jgi:hypothetical protein
VKDEEGSVYYVKRLLIATGLADPLPEVKGFEEMYGKQCLKPFAPVKYVHPVKVRDLKSKEFQY